MYRNTGNGTLVDVTPSILASTFQNGSCSWGDADGDGRLDLWVSPQSSSAQLFRNLTLTANHWLNLDLHGVTTNRSAIGARVRAVAGSLVQTRWVGMGNGIGQSSLTVELGIGAATQIDTLQVFWPSGIRQDTVAVAANQRLDLYEHLALLDVGEPLRVPGRTIERISPNPFGRGTRIDYALAASGRVRIAVHDVTGRRVATLVDAAAPAGRGSVAWNPAASGLRAGVYEIRVESEAGTATQRVVYTR